MTYPQVRRATGTLLIVGAILVNIPYALLISTFDYPDILRLPSAEILTRFAAGGPALIWTWLAFAWTGLPILLGILLLPQALADDQHPAQSQLFSTLALFFGAVGAVTQMIGLLRWPFVVPVLARLYTDPQATAAMQEAMVAVFQAVHQYGGVVLGEHIGQTFTILWMIFLSIHLLRRKQFPAWFPWAGIAAAIVYGMAQAELLATAIPGFPVWSEAGLFGSLLWLGWLVVLGILLLQQKGSITVAHTGQDPQHSVGAL